MIIVPKTQNTELSDMLLYRLDMTSKFNIFSEKLTVKSHATFAFRDYYFRLLLIMHLIAF